MCVIDHTELCWIDAGLCILLMGCHHNNLDDGLIMQVGDGKVGSNPINLTQEQSADYWYNNGLGRGYKPNIS